MRVKLKLEALQNLMARSSLSQNHWAIKIGMSRGHWSEIVNGKHIHPSPKTRERMLGVFGVGFEELFEIEVDAPAWSDPNFQSAVHDRYVIDKEIGQGGMGTVFLARDVKLGRQVAIKVLSAEAVSGIGVKRFLREIRLTAGLQHPNILGIHDADEAAGHPFYVMPFVPGGSLRALLEERTALPLQKVLPIALGIAKALDYAHDHQVLHCDIKPENILLSDEHAYVADFGIARAIHSEVFEWGVTEGLDSSAGTPAYVSPEQASGVKNIDGRADVYSFACVVFEMLTGRPPFSGKNTMDVVSQRFTSEVPDVRALAPDVSDGVASAIERAMSLVPERRTATATELVAELKRSTKPTNLFGRLIKTAVGIAARTARSLKVPNLRRGSMESIVQDLRQAWRSLLRSPGFAFIAAGTLAIGIGANTAVFTVINGVLLRPLPYDHPDELTMFWELDKEGVSGAPEGKWTVSPAVLAAWSERNTTMSDISGFNISFPTLADEQEARRLSGAVVTHNFFNVLGVAPILGSVFQPEHGIPGNEQVAVISFGLWQQKFNADSSVIGSTINLSGSQYTVLGVMPKTFRHPEPEVLDPTEIWRPLAWSDPSISASRYLRVLGRRKPGTSHEAVAAEFSVIAQNLEVTLPESQSGWGVMVRPLREELFGAVRTPLLLMLLGAGFVLLIVCANVANIVLARAHGRRKEFALRASLGAGRGRLARQLITENLLVTFTGGTAGLLLVQGASGFVGAVQTQYISNVARIEIDVTVILFMMVIAAATGIAFGLLPVFQASRTDLRSVLTEESAGAGKSRRARGLRNGLVVAEVLLATVLAIGAGLMAKSFRNMVERPTGFAMENLMTFDLVLPRTRYDSPEAIQLFYDQLRDGLASVPELSLPSFVSDLPFTTENRFAFVNSSIDSRTEEEWPMIEFSAVGSNFFSTMGIPFLAGEPFRNGNRNLAQMPVVINRSLAEQFWPSQNAVGQTILLRGEDHTAVVVGIAGDILDDGFNSEFEPRFYQPFEWSPSRFYSAIVLTSGDRQAAISAVRREVRALDATVLPTGFAMMEDIMSGTLADDRIALSLAGVFSFLALALAAIGIYGVVAYSVRERRQEIGIRIALGAQRNNVMKLVLGHMIALTVIGAAGGMIVAIPGIRILEAFLYEVSPWDPFVLGLAPLFLIGVALAASYIPANRATRVHPVEALKGNG